MSDAIGQMRNSWWFLGGAMVCFTLSVVFMLLNSFESRHPSPAEEMFWERLSGAGRNHAPGPPSRVPTGDIPMMFEMFRVTLMAEAPGFPIEEMEKSIAWAHLRERVAAYDQALERTCNEVEKERLRMSDLLSVSFVHSARRRIRMSCLTILSIFGGIVFMLLDTISSRRAIAEL